jgi:IclR family transcriptional regulator, KDG regulon repressor
MNKVTGSEFPDAPAATGGAGKISGGVQSIERAFGLLEEIARNREGIALADLSKRSGLHNSTTFHLLKTMMVLGYVTQVRDSKRYRIGRRLFTLAAGAVDDVELVNLVKPVLEELANATTESAFFAAWSGKEVTIIAHTHGSGVFQLADRAGVARPAHCTALGKVLLAALSPEHLARYLKQTELRSFTPRTITEPRRLIAELEEIRRTGIAFDDGEFDPELRCAAVPVRDFTSNVVGALGVSGPIWRLALHALEGKAAHLRAAARKLSTELGHSSEVEPGSQG